MSTKQKLLNKLLTTTSALAMIMEVQNIAIAAGQAVGRGNKNLSDVGITGPAHWVIFNKGGLTLTVDQMAPEKIAGMRVNKHRLSLIVNNDIIIGSISGGKRGKPITVTINDAQLTLNGTNFDGVLPNIYDKLGTITLRHANAKLIIDANIALPNQIQGNLRGGDQGMITVNDSKTLTLAQRINPTQPIGQLTLGPNAPSNA